jgi:16S rRNA (guanine527-N7)-methyltransferase
MVREQILRRAARAEVGVSPATLSGLLTYYDILARWNRRINLTAIDLARPTDAGIDRLIVEPLVASAHIPPSTRLLIDIGSGGGSPSIPMRLAAPFGTWALVEARQRKAAFLREVIRTLALPHVEVVTDRMERVALNAGMAQASDVVTFRAVRADGSLWDAINLVLAKRGRVIWFTSERADAPPWLTVVERRSSSFLVLQRINADDEDDHS